MEIIQNELQVPANYIKLTDNRLSLTVHKSWLNSFLKIGRVSFITHDKLTAAEIAAQPSEHELGSDWKRVYAKVYKKQHKNVIPLPKCRHSYTKSHVELTFSQLLHYVSETNYHNLWKESYKKYSRSRNCVEQGEQSNIIETLKDATVMHEVLARMYGCTVVHVKDEMVLSILLGRINDAHCNLLPVIFAIETSSAFFIIYERTAKYSLRECVMYSPAALGISHKKPLFLVYQLLRLSRDLHDLGLVLGEITLSDILLMDNLTIQVIPKLTDNIYSTPQTNLNCSPNYDQKKSCNKQNHERVNSFSMNMIPGNPEFGKNECIERLCEIWVYGRISNFDYLTALNNIAGRRYGDPICHHVMPWVTDFSSRYGRNWRDLTKSKFRLNKGDRQLDLTFDSQSSEVGHHVSDVISEITYYVYLARRFSRAILCKHVRPLWVPEEYPASIQRLHDWSPDECIPQFFTDPNVFKSIHEDLPDLEVPAWATSPEDFIAKHREALESNYVSERLHHWIDLTFGYKLSGSAAIKSKNVCLQLVDNHINLTSSGVVQLFTQPHPQKMLPSPYWGKVPPRLKCTSLSIKTKNDKSGSKASDEEEHSSGLDEEDLTTPNSNTSKSSPLVLSRLSNRSRGSLQSTEETTKSDKFSTQTIVLPKDYNPVSALIYSETLHGFMTRVNHRVYKTEQRSYDMISNFKQIVASSRIKEQQILGGLIVEIFLPSKFRATWNVEIESFTHKLQMCYNVLKVSPESLPRCVRNAVALSLQFGIIPKSYNIDNAVANELSFCYPTVTLMGLPPPSAHQFLQPILSSSLFPHSKYCEKLFNIIKMLQEYNNLIQELNYVWQPEEDSFDSLRKTKIRFLCKISECKIKSLARELNHLGSNTDGTKENMQLIVSLIENIIEEPFSAVLAVWYLFDPIAKALGPKNTAHTFLIPIIKLYENGSILDNHSYNDVLPLETLQKFRTTRLYHRTFLLKLMVRLGLHRFLENFITPLVEAVGGCRDSVMGSTNIKVHRTGNLKNCGEFSGTSGDADNILSPLEEDFSTASENIPSSTGPILNSFPKHDAEEVFDIETEEISCESSHSEYPNEFDTNLNINDEFNDENDSQPSPPLCLIKSPTIPIPIHSTSMNAKLSKEFHSLSLGGTSYMEDNDIPKKNYSEQTERSITVLRSSISNQSIRNESGQFSRDNYQRYTSYQCMISEMSTESVIWLSHRLGPVLTARHLSRNLLRMLTLCYTGKENLTAIMDEADTTSVKLQQKSLIGDVISGRVLECLISIAGLYGEQMVVVQYFTHAVDLLTLCKTKLTPNLEGGLISSVVLLDHMLSCLNDSTLMDVLHEIIVKSILYPVVRILSTTKYTFPNGVSARQVLADKFLKVMFTLSIRLGSVMIKNHLAVPIQRFFLAFDKSHAKTLNVQENENNSTKTNYARTPHEGSSPDSIGDGDVTLSESNRSASNSYNLIGSETPNSSDLQRKRALEELRLVFTARYAYKAYIFFYRHTSVEIMEQILKNHERIRDLCHEYEQEIKVASPNMDYDSCVRLYSIDCSITNNEESINKDNFDTISVVGNKFQVQTNTNEIQSTREYTYINRELIGSLSSGRPLRGNWLAYWEHEIGRPDKDLGFNFKQIKLQSFSGHNNSVKSLHVLDNENSFMSGSRDKTVKLWSLRSQGDGSTVSSCQYTYTGHKKSILALTFIESLRYAITCDGTIHCWDPFMGSLLGCPESNRPVPVNTLIAGPSPSTSLFVATTDVTLRIIDCRIFQYVNEMRISMNPTGLIRCIAIPPSGHWVALGQASGFITLLDIRTGLVVASWKGHECEILQLEAINETTIISSSLDQTIAAWSSMDGKLKFHIKGATEPVHCMSVYGQGLVELVLATTANRIGVYNAWDTTTHFSSTKLRSDVFKGVLTAMTILPLNHLLLLGADNGGITLLC